MPKPILDLYITPLGRYELANFFNRYLRSPNLSLKLSGKVHDSSINCLSRNGDLTSKDAPILATSTFVNRASGN